MASTYMIDRLISRIRRNTDEPAVKAKFTDDELIERIEDSCRKILGDLNSVTDNALVVRHPISVVKDSTVFLLPPNVEQVRKLVKLNDTTGAVSWDYEPYTDLRARGPGFCLEGRVLRFDPPWQGSDETLYVWYVPNGDFRLHYGTAARVTATSVTLASTPTKGSLDTRENCYAGAILRIVDSTEGLVQERFVTAYDRVGRIATLDIELSPLPTGTVTYEIVPAYQTHLEDVVGWDVAVGLKAMGGDSNRYWMLGKEQAKAMRGLRLAAKRMNNIVGTAFTQPSGQSTGWTIPAGVTI